ncbi:WD repeat-containing protein 25 [Mactra antiquata]
MDAILGYASSNDESDTNEPEEASVVRLQPSGYKCDYFGLVSESEKLSESHPVGNTVVTNVSTGDNEVSVEIPDSSFWSDLKETDIHKFQNESERNVSAGHSKMKNLSSKNKSRFNPIGDKRKRQINSPTSSRNNVKPHEVTPSISGSLTDRKLFFVHSKVQPLLHSKSKLSKIPSSREWTNPGHAGATNRLKWNIPNYSHILASCSMDSTIKLWNIWTQLDSCVQMLSVHTKAVRDIAWSSDGRQILSASYDRSSCITDVERGSVITRFPHNSYVTCCKYHPENQHLSITGSHNQIQTWDHRSPTKPCKIFTYKDKFGQVQDIVLTEDGSTVFSCSDLLSRDSADRNLMCWDYNTGIVLSNQIYQDTYNIIRMKIHPLEPQLLAQSTGNYIALFSLQRPYKMLKHKKYSHHKSQEYNIGFDISPNGQIVYSGSDQGKIYCYDYASGRHIKTLNTNLPVAMDIACHPVLPSTVSVSSWDGSIEVWR